MLAWDSVCKNMAVLRVGLVSVGWLELEGEAWCAGVVTVRRLLFTVTAIAGV